MLYFQSFFILVQLFIKTIPRKQVKIIKICYQKTPYFQNKFSKKIFSIKKFTKHVFESGKWLSIFKNRKLFLKLVPK